MALFKKEKKKAAPAAKKANEANAQKPAAEDIDLSKVKPAVLMYEARKRDVLRHNRSENTELELRKRSEISDYGLPDDVDLTDEQKAEIDAFWGKYEFMGKIDYRAFKTYYNRSGICDPRYLPQYVYSYFLRPNTVPSAYSIPLQNKAYLPNLLCTAKQPVMVARYMEGNYYDKDFNHITEEEAVQLGLDALKETEIVVKPSGKAGGKGVEFLTSATFDELKAVYGTKGDIFVVQKAIKQHPEMAKLNPSTVNTVRLTTILHNGKFRPAAALIKVGAPNVRVDNYKHGGCLLGVHLDGTVNDWALNIDRQRVTELPSGVKLGEGGFTRVPCFDSVLATAEKAHYCIPKIKVVSWDIAIDNENEAEIIEANFAGDLRMHQMVTGPVFGDMTEEMLDAYVLPRVHRPGVTEMFDYEEFANSIVITKYRGPKKRVVVPAEINGKPVRTIGAYAFAYNRFVTEITLPDSITTLRRAAFLGCRNLETLNINLDTLKRSDKEVVNWCNKLEKELKVAIRTKVQM